MKTRAVTWIAAFALAGVCVGQQSDEEAEFSARVSVSKAKAVAIYPDVTNSQSRLVGRMKEIDQKLKAEESDLHYSPDKPFVLAEMAAKELGISPVKQVVTEPEREHSRFATSQTPTEKLKAAKEALAPHIAAGCNMARKSYIASGGDMRYGASKKYVYSKGPIMGLSKAEALAKFEETWAASPAAVRMNWARKAMLSGATVEAQQAEAIEEAAARDRILAPSSNQISYIEGGKYQKRGNILTSNGNFGSGYAIDGDSLTKNGSVTHKKSGSMWMPVKPGEKQIYDP